MKLEIIISEKKLFDGKVKLVKVPGASGSFEILNNHAPIISTLTKGTIKVITETDQKELIDIDSGIVEVKANSISILAIISGS